MVVIPVFLDRQSLATSQQNVGVPATLTSFCRETRKPLLCELLSVFEVHEMKPLLNPFPDASGRQLLWRNPARS